MNGSQCDYCRMFVHDPAGWYVVAKSGTEKDMWGRVAPVPVATFCTKDCLASWAYVHSQVEETT